MADEMGAESTGQIRQDMETLRGDLREVRADLSHLRDDAAKAVRHGASEVRGRIDEHLKTVTEKGRQTVQSVEGRVQEHPVISLAVAFVVGLVVGVAVTKGR